jgi:hypothetical protein
MGKNNRGRLPTMPSYFNRPTHWRVQAEMTRTIAKDMRGPERQILYGIASDYDKMALQLESSAIAAARQERREQPKQPVGLGESVLALQQKWNKR